MPIQKCNFKFF